MVFIETGLTHLLYLVSLNLNTFVTIVNDFTNNFKTKNIQRIHNFYWTGIEMYKHKNYIFKISSLPPTCNVYRHSFDFVFV